MAVDRLRGIRLELTRLGGKLGRELGVPSHTQHNLCGNEALCERAPTWLGRHGRIRGAPLEQRGRARLFGLSYG
jgi:hypothetical protein